MSFYRTLTLLHTDVPSDQTNFPVGFIGTYTYLKTVANGGKVQNTNGYDIYFTSDVGGSSLLNFERVAWDATTGAVEFWVQVPTLSSSVDTVIYLWYGNNAISTDQQNKNGTWDTNYVGVYHFGNSVLSVADSTSNANNGTNHGGTAAGDTFVSQGSLALDSGSTQYVDLGTGSSLNVQQNLTIEVWFFDKSSGGVFEFICSNLSNPSSNGYAVLCHQGVDCYLALLNAGTETDVQGAGFTGAWHFFTATYDNAHSKFYTDAALNNTTTASGASGSSANNTMIGKDPRSGGANYVKGWIDELRISKVARPADYITTVKNNINDYVSFITVGTENSGATPINQTASDSFSFSDSELLFLPAALAFADSQAGNWGDSIAFTLGIPGIGIVDDYSALWGDSVELGINGFLSFNDTVALTDQFPFAPAMNMMAFEDTLSLSDSEVVQISIVLSLSDSFTFTDLVQLVGADLINITEDQFSFSDNALFDIPIDRIFDDNFIWRDGQKVAWSSIVPTFSDTLSLSDSITVNNAPFWTVVNESLSDGFSFSDNYALNAGIMVATGDDFSPSDSIQVVNSFNPFNQLFTDNLVFVDGVLLILQGDLLQFADSFILSDNVLVQNATSFDSYIRRYLNDEPV